MQFMYSTSTDSTLRNGLRFIRFCRQPRFLLEVASIRTTGATRWFAAPDRTRMLSQSCSVLMVSPTAQSTTVRV